MSRSARNLTAAVAVAALLWFFMFTPWIACKPNFWFMMSCSAVILTALALLFSGGKRDVLKIEKPLLQLAAGIVLAFLLWGVFWVGDKLSAMMFDFARPEVDAVYSMKHGLPHWAIAVLLLFLIGPAEEFFWRGFVQRTLSELFHGKNAGFTAFVVTALIYSLVHVWSLNFMLVMAALVAGCVWGFIYWLCPKALPALIVSHALWDALVFVILPI